MSHRPRRISTLGLILLIASSAANAQLPAYITNELGDSVSVIDTGTNTILTTIAVGDAPQGVAVNSANTWAYVANGDADTVSVIEVASNTVFDTIVVGDNPQGVAVSPDGFRV